MSFLSPVWGLEYDTSKLSSYIEQVAAEDATRLPTLGLYLAQVKQRYAVDTESFILLSESINHIIGITQRVDPPAGYAVMTSTFL